MEGTKFSGNISKEDIAEATRLKAEHSKYIEDWEHVATTTVHEHEVTLHRRPLQNDTGLFEYYAYGTLPLRAEELALINWDVEYRLQWDEYAKSITVHSSFEHEDVKQDVLHWEVDFFFVFSF